MLHKDKLLFTGIYQANIRKTGIDAICTLCDNFTETVDHIITGNPVLAPNEQHHDRVGQNLHWKICIHYQLSAPNNWFEHHPQAVVERENVTARWDFPIYTNRTIQVNMPDITVKDSIEKTCLCYVSKT